MATIINLTGDIAKAQWAADIKQGDVFTHRLISLRDDGTHRLILRDLDGTFVAEGRSEETMSTDEVQEFVTLALGGVGFAFANAEDLAARGYILRAGEGSEPAFVLIEPDILPDENAPAQGQWLSGTLYQEGRGWSGYPRQNGLGDIRSANVYTSDTVEGMKEIIADLDPKSLRDVYDAEFAEESERLGREVLRRLAAGEDLDDTEYLDDQGATWALIGPGVVEVTRCATALVIVDGEALTEEEVRTVGVSA